MKANEKTAVRRLYDTNPEAFKRRLSEASGNLFAQGYRVKAFFVFGVFLVTTPKRKTLLVDHYGGLCNCKFSQQHRLPCGCIHLRGLETLVCAQAAYFQEWRQWKDSGVLLRHWNKSQEARLKTDLSDVLPLSDLVSE